MKDSEGYFELSPKDDKITSANDDELVTQIERLIVSPLPPERFIKNTVTVKAGKLGPV